MSFYVTTILPLGVAIGVLSGLGQLLWWTRSTRGEFLRSLLVPTLIALAAAALGVGLGVRTVQVALFVFGAAFSLAVNTVVGWRVIRGTPRFSGGAIAHVGLAVMFLGFVTSSAFDEKVTLSLTQGKQVEALGYTLTYTGYRPVDQEKFAFEVLVERPGKASHVVAPIMYYSSYTEGLMRNPDIANFVTHDFYLAPLSLEQKSGTARNEELRLRKGEEKMIGDLAVRLVEYTMPLMQTASSPDQPAVATALLEIRQGSATPQIVTVGSAPVRLLGRYDIRIRDMQPDIGAPEKATVELVVDQLSKPSGPGGEKDVLVVEASVKPYINLVWSGVLILLLGLIVTIVRRVKES
jgi:cytochrome c-type biogenesis protein CcmF